MLLPWVRVLPQLLLALVRGTVAALLLLLLLLLCWRLWAGVGRGVGVGRVRPLSMRPSGGGGLLARVAVAMRAVAALLAVTAHRCRRRAWRRARRRMVGHICGRPHLRWVDSHVVRQD